MIPTRRLLTVAPLALLFVFPALPVHAQAVSIYGTYSPLHASNIETGLLYNSTSGFNPQYANFWTSGFGGGVTIRLLPLPVVSLGLDLRGSTRPGTVGADTALVGLKLGVHPPRFRIKPYIQASVGYLATRTVNVTNAPTVEEPIGGTRNHQYFAYEVLGGVDYPLTHFIDYRVVEFGAGQSLHSGSPRPGFYTLNTGIVFHF
jgi:hypothetical protein